MVIMTDINIYFLYKMLTYLTSMKLSFDFMNNYKVCSNNQK